jgi:ERCC4-type nuclease
MKLKPSSQKILNYLRTQENFLTTARARDRFGIQNVAARVKELREAGYISVESIATASPAELSEISEISESTAKKIIKAARQAADIGGFKTGKDIFEQRKDVRNYRSAFQNSMRCWVGDWRPRL